MQTKLFITAIAMLITTGSYAQDVTTLELKKEPGKNEAGLFIEMQTAWSTNYQSNAGLQYKRWVRPNKAYRIMGGLGDYNVNSPSFFKQKIGDTVVSAQFYTHVPMYFVGGGLEMQRHFYKKVYLYAALELKAGYGNGTSDEMTIKEVQKELPPYYYSYSQGVSSNMRSNVTAFVLDVAPMVGAKFNFRRLCFGTEASFVHLGMESVKYDKYPGNSNFNFDGFNLRQRIYLNYRF